MKPSSEEGSCIYFHFRATEANDEPSDKIHSITQADFILNKSFMKKCRKDTVIRKRPNRAAADAVSMADCELLIIVLIMCEDNRVADNKQHTMNQLTHTQTRTHSIAKTQRDSSNSCTRMRTNHEAENIQAESITKMI